MNRKLMIISITALLILPSMSIGSTAEQVEKKRRKTIFRRRTSNQRCSIFTTKRVWLCICLYRYDF